MILGLWKSRAGLDSWECQMITGEKLVENVRFLGSPNEIFSITVHQPTFLDLELQTEAIEIFLKKTLPIIYF